MPSERDLEIINDYLGGTSIKELSRTHGIHHRRVRQILSVNKVKLRPRLLQPPVTISGIHVRIGLALYKGRTDRKKTPKEVAEDLDWSVIKVRKIEQGLSELEILEVAQISSYLKIPIQKLLGNKYG